MATLSAGTEYAFAKKGGADPRDGGFSGPGPEVLTVKQALAMSDKGG